MAVLLGLGPLGTARMPGEGRDDFVIQAERFLPNLSSTLRQPQIKYGIDVLIISVVPDLKPVISSDYTPDIPFDPRFSDVLTRFDRGPPSSRDL